MLYIWTFCLAYKEETTGPYFNSTQAPNRLLTNVKGCSHKHKSIHNSGCRQDKTIHRWHASDVCSSPGSLCQIIILAARAVYFEFGLLIACLASFMHIDIWPIGEALVLAICSIWHSRNRCMWYTPLTKYDQYPLANFSRQVITLWYTCYLLPRSTNPVADSRYRDLARNLQSSDMHCTVDITYQRLAYPSASKIVVLLKHISYLRGMIPCKIMLSSKGCRYPEK